MERHLLECFGKLHIKGKETYKNKKALLLLAYLLLEPKDKKHSSGTLASKFFPDAENPKASLSNAKWWLNDQLGEDVVSKSYQVQGVDTDIELLLAACDKGELETVKNLFFKGACFNGLEQDADIHDDLQTWTHAWRERVERRVWEVLLAAAATQSSNAHHLIEETYETTQTFPEHDLDYCHALLKVGGSYLTDVVVARFKLEPLSLEEAKKLLEERRQTQKSIEPQSPAEAQSSSRVVAPEQTLTEVVIDHASPAASAPIENKTDLKTGRSEGTPSTSSSKPSSTARDPEKRALLEIIKNRFEAARTSEAKRSGRQVVSKYLPLTRSELVWTVAVGMLILAVASQFIWGVPRV
jgi:hypothetical protein